MTHRPCQLGFDALLTSGDRPFLSATGYRSFLGLHADPVPALLPDEFAAKVIANYVARERKGRLAAISLAHRAMQKEGST